MTRKTPVTSKDGYTIFHCVEEGPPRVETFEIVGPNNFQQGNLTEGQAYALLDTRANLGRNNAAPPPPQRPKPRF